MPSTNSCHETLSPSLGAVIVMAGVSVTVEVGEGVGVGVGVGVGLTVGSGV